MMIHNHTLPSKHSIHKHTSIVSLPITCFLHVHSEHSYITTCLSERKLHILYNIRKMINHMFSRYCHTELMIYSLTDATSYHLSPPHVHTYVRTCRFVSFNERKLHTYVCTVLLEFDSPHLLSHVVDSYSALVQAQIMVHNYVLSCM